MLIGNVDVEGRILAGLDVDASLSPITQGNHWNKGISLEQALHVGAGLEE